MIYMRNALSARCALLAVVIAMGTGGLSTTSAAEEQATAQPEINYATGDPASWPEELEATIAAPDNHKILLENDEVRVLEVSLAPGQTEPLHFHRWPSVLHILEAGEWIDRDAEGNVLFDSRETSVSYPMTMWKGPEAPHSPVNLSTDKWIRLIRVELKKGVSPDAVTIGD